MEKPLHKISSLTMPCKTEMKLVSGSKTMILDSQVKSLSFKVRKMTAIMQKNKSSLAGAMSSASKKS